MKSNDHSGDLSSKTNSSALPAPESMLSLAYQVSADSVKFVENHPRETMEWAALIAGTAAAIYYRHPDFSQAVIREVEPTVISRMPSEMPSGINGVAATVDAATRSQIKELPHLVLIDQSNISINERQRTGLESLGVGDDTFVDPLASIGLNVKLGKNVEVEFDAQVGDHSVIADGAILEHSVQIGKNVKIIGQPENGFSGALIGPESSIGDNVIISPGVHIGARVKIHSGVLIGPNTYIQDDVIVHKDVTIGGGAHLSHHSIVRANSNIRDHAYLGNYSTIGEGVTIGSGVFIRDKIVRASGEVFRQISIGDRTIIGKEARIFKSVSPDLKIASRAIVN